MKNEQIQVPDEMPVKITAKEVSEIIAYLENGAFKFVNPVIQALQNAMIKSYQEGKQKEEAELSYSVSNEEKKPIGGGDGSAKPPRDE